MSLDRSKKLRADGFDLVAVKVVALCHTVWKTNLSLSCDRRLTLSEETVLGLIDAGVSEPLELSELMGLEPGVIVKSTIVGLLTKGLLRHVDKLTVTPLGTQALKEEVVRTERSYADIWLRHDPYTNSFSWRFRDEVLSLNEVRRRQLQPLPAPDALQKLDVEIRHREVQELIDRFGLPIDRDTKN